jgi:hypothetical protein
MSLKSEQKTMAKFLSDASFEADVRADPARIAEIHGVSVAFAERLAAIEPRRVRAFRASMAHKAGVRERSS